jgi:tetratricopeptide (TPR) repeat protein
LGSVAQQQGDLATARRLYDEALAAARAANDMEPVIYLLFCAGSLAIDAGEPDAAAPLLVEALTLGQEADARADIAESLGATSRFALDRGEYATACRLQAAVDHLREAIGFGRGPAEAVRYEEQVERLREACGESFAAEWAAGTVLSLDDTIALAVATLTNR